MNIRSPGQRLDDRYRLVKQVGSGGTSVVFDATVNCSPTCFNWDGCRREAATQRQTLAPSCQHLTLGTRESIPVHA